MELMDSGAGACPPVSVSSTLHSVLQINAVQAISVNFTLQHHNLRDAQLQLSAYIYVSLFRLLGHHWCSSPSCWISCYAGGTFTANYFLPVQR